MPNMTSYEYIASTTPHSSMPREGDRVTGTGVISSPRYMPVGDCCTQIVVKGFPKVANVGPVQFSLTAEVHACGLAVDRVELVHAPC